MNSEEESVFDNTAIVACGTLSVELNHLKRGGYLNARRVLYTKPGRHEVPSELERQLVDRIAIARRFAERVVVVYGGKFCYLNPRDPYRNIDTIIEEQGAGVSRIKATHCVDMLIGPQERELASEGKKVFWLTPGWVKYRDFVFQDWDKGKANETFPQNSAGGLLLDAVGFWDDYSAAHAERLLELSDWMGIPIRPYQISLDRLKRLLTECALAAHRSAG